MRFRPNTVDGFYKHFEYSYNPPILYRLLRRRCHFCKRILSDVEKEDIVMGEVLVGFDEPSTERFYWCSEKCVAEWRQYMKQLESREERLNTKIIGGEA